MNTQAAAERVRYAVTGEGAMDLRTPDHENVWRAADVVARACDDHEPPVLLLTQEQVDRYARQLDQHPDMFTMLWGVPVVVRSPQAQ